MSLALHGACEDHEEHILVASPGCLSGHNSSDTKGVKRSDPLWHFACFDILPLFVQTGVCTCLVDPVCTRPEKEPWKVEPLFILNQPLCLQNMHRSLINQAEGWKGIVFRKKEMQFSFWLFSCQASHCNFIFIFDNRSPSPSQRIFNPSDFQSLTWGPIYGSVSDIPSWYLTNATLADEDIDSILTDVNRQCGPTWCLNLQLTQSATPNPIIVYAFVCKKIESSNRRIPWLFLKLALTIHLLTTESHNKQTTQLFYYHL